MHKQYFRNGLLASALVLSLPVAQAAAVLAINLTIANSGTINDGSNTATFTFDKMQPSGTGVLDPFLRVQRNSTEQGYNATRANAGAQPFEEKFGIWTRDLSFSGLQLVNGTYNFVLDIGEPVSNNTNQGQQSLLSLDGLKIYATSTPGQTSNSVDGAGDANGIMGTLLWNMDALQDNYILLDANRNGNPGNGVSDMLMELPTSIFSGVTASDYIVLWSRFGLQNASNSGAESFGTFEEWAQLKPGTSSTSGGTSGTSSTSSGASGTVPEPTSSGLVFLGLGLVAASFWTRRRGAKPGPALAA